MDLRLFKLMEVVFRAYSRQAPKRLIDHYLRLRVILRLPHAALHQLCSQIQLSAPEQAVFSSKTKGSRSLRTLLVVIDHPLGLPLAPLLLQNVEECIVINQGGNCSNVLGMEKGHGSQPTKGVLLKLSNSEFEELSQNLDAYLSVCEVFLGHLHLTLSCFESEPSIDLALELTAVEGDEFADFRENGYFRVLQERASRVTLEELSVGCRIERQGWGEMLVFEGGQECLIVWVTCDRLPLLGVVPSVRLNKKRSNLLPLMLESDLGLKIFKQREYLKSKLEDLETTTIIFNVQEYSEQVKAQVEGLFDREATSFFSRGSIEKDSYLLHESIANCERICEILQLPAVELLKKLMRA